MSTQYISLITGANRGLGLGLLKLYLARPNNTVIAGVRDPASYSKALLELPKGENSSVVVVKIDSSSASDAAAAVEELQSKHGIHHLDLVIANAGIAESMSPVRKVEIDALTQHMEVNVYAVVRLYQATIPLLEKASAPKWASMSSLGGSMAEQPPFPNTQYGMSKAALNFVTKKIDQENETLAAFAMHPGWVATDMGNRGAKMILGEEKAPDALDETVAALQKVLDNATKETLGGKFVWNDGEVHLW